jgi:prephenate dehydratase
LWWAQKLSPRAAWSNADRAGIPTTNEYTVTMPTIRPTVTAITEAGGSEVVASPPSFSAECHAVRATAYLLTMRIGYQGEPLSYSHRAVTELFPDGEAVGVESFAGAFAALDAGMVDRLVLPVENSTTGSVLPVLDRLPGDVAHDPIAIVAEHLVEVRHALLGIAGARLEDLVQVQSHAEALAQAEGALLALGIEAVPMHDTAGAVREVAERRDPTVGALAPPAAGEAFGLVVLQRDVLDRDHNTTRFVVLAPGEPRVDPGDDKTTLVFTTSHTPGALALVLTELGLRGANLTRIESRPATEAWSYRFFVDLVHVPGPAGLAAVIDPPPATCAELKVLGSYRGVPPSADPPR